MGLHQGEIIHGLAIVFRIEQDESLQDFGDSGPELPGRKRPQRIGTDIDPFRLGDRTDHILIGMEIHAVLTPDRSVHLRQQRRRYETEPNTPFVNRRRETAEVGRDAAAHAHEKRAPVGSPLQQLFDNIFYRSEGFNLLGGLDRNEFIPFEKAEKGLQVAVDNDENPSALRNQGIQTAEIG